MRFRALASIVVVLCCAGLLNAGGPLNLFAPGVPYAYGPLTFNQFGGNVPFKTDRSGLGFLTKAQADALAIASMAEWTAVPTASLTLAFALDITDEFGVPLGADIDETNFDLVLGVFNGGGIDVVYDETGAIFDALFGPGAGVIGFAEPEFFFTGAPEIEESFVLLNGSFVDPGDVNPFPGASFQGVFTHEFGHTIGLAHTQTNGAILFFGDNTAPEDCPSLGAAMLAHAETMYPFADVTPAPPGGTSYGREIATIDHPDDKTALSELYPEAGYFDLPTITGTIFASDGATPITGANVIARNVANPLADAVSSLSGDFSLRDADDDFDGTYTFTGLTPGASYIIYIDRIVAGGFSTPPIQIEEEEYFNGASESADPNIDNPCAFTPIAPVAGSPFVANIIMEACHDDNESNDTPDTATGPIPYDSDEDGCIDPPGDEDWFTFSATAGDIIEVRVRHSNSDSQLDPTLTLYDTDGATILAFNDDENFPISFDSRLTFCMPSTGAFFLQVEGFEGVSTGEYKLALKFLSQGDAEPNNTPATAIPLPSDCPKIVLGCILPELDTDFYSLAVPAAGTTFTIDMDAPSLLSGPPNAFLILYDTDGTTMLAFDDDSGPGLGARITFTFPAPGTYFVECLTSPFPPSNTTGVYSLNVSGGPPTILHTNNLRVDARAGGNGGWTEYRPGFPDAAADHFFDGHFGYFDGDEIDDGDDFGTDIVPGCFNLYDPSKGPLDEKSADFLNEDDPAVMKGRGTGLEIQQFTSLNDRRGAAGAIPANWLLVQTRAVNKSGVPKHVKWYKFIDMDVLDTFNNDLAAFDPSRNMVYQFNASGNSAYIGIALVLGNLTNFQINNFDAATSPDANDAARLAFMNGLNGGDLSIPGPGDKNVALAADLGVIPPGGSADLWWALGAGTSLAELQADIDDARLAALRNFFTIYSGKLTKLDHPEAVNGLTGSNSSIILDHSEVNGDLWAKGEITITHRSTINGNVTAGANLDISSHDVAITGAITSAATGFAGFPLPSLSLSPVSGPSFTVTKSHGAVLKPGHYNVVQVNENKSIQLKSGVYFFNSLKVGAHAGLKVDLSGGPVTINVVKTLQFLKMSEIATKSRRRDSSRDIRINYAGTGTVVLGENGEYQGAIFAPNGTIDLGVVADFKGMLLGKFVNIRKGGRVFPHDAPDNVLHRARSFGDETKVTSNGVVIDYELSQNYPNPFSANGNFGNPSTKIRFALPEAGKVKLEIYDLLGNTVRALINKEMSTGRHEVLWDGRNQNGHTAAVGIYFYRIVFQRSNGEPATVMVKKMSFIK